MDGVSSGKLICLEGSGRTQVVFLHQDLNAKFFPSQSMVSLDSLYHLRREKSLLALFGGVYGSWLRKFGHGL